MLKKIMTSIALISCAFGGEIASADQTRVAKNNEAKIDVHQTCRVVKNSGQVDIMVPHSNASEWSTGNNAFLQNINGMTGVAVSPCVSGPLASLCGLGNGDCVFFEWYNAPTIIVVVDGQVDWACGLVRQNFVTKHTTWQTDPNSITLAEADELWEAAIAKVGLKAVTPCRGRHASYSDPVYLGHMNIWLDEAFDKPNYPWQVRVDRFVPATLYGWTNYDYEVKPPLITNSSNDGGVELFVYHIEPRRPGWNRDFKCGKNDNSCVIMDYHHGIVTMIENGVVTRTCYGKHIGTTQNTAAATAADRTALKNLLTGNQFNHHAPSWVQNGFTEVMVNAYTRHCNFTPNLADWKAGNGNWSDLRVMFHDNSIAYNVGAVIWDKSPFSPRRWDTNALERYDNIKTYKLVPR